MPFNFPLPAVNAYKFKHSLALRQVSRAVDDAGILSFLGKLGPDRVDWLIKHNRPLLSQMLEKAPDWYSGLKKEAPRFHWVSDVLSDSDLASILPEWLLGVVSRNGDAGRLWLTNELSYLRGFFVTDDKRG